jgi:hypothetical protein
MQSNACVADHVGKLAKDFVATLHRFHGADVVLDYPVALGEFTDHLDEFRFIQKNCREEDGDHQFNERFVVGRPSRSIVHGSNSRPADLRTFFGKTFRLRGGRVS